MMVLEGAQAERFLRDFLANVAGVPFKLGEHPAIPTRMIEVRVPFEFWDAPDGRCRCKTSPGKCRS